MTVLGTVNFAGFSCKVILDRYMVDSKPALVLVESATGENIGKVSVNLSNIADIPSDHIAIKNYSELEGILDILIEANIISDPVRYIKSGHVNIPICKLYV